MTQGKDWTPAIEPEPSDEEREAILAALGAGDDEPSVWGEAALAESVEAGEAEPDFGSAR